MVTSLEKADMTEAEQAFARRYPRLHAALLALGETNAERAAALGISLRQFHDVKQGVVSLKASRLEQQPALARAWLADVEALHGANLAA